MKRFKALVVVAVLVLTVAAAAGRLWYSEDIKWGTSTSTTSDGLPLSAVNASKIPLTTGSNIEAVLTSLQSQVTALSTALALKAPIDSPTFTGPVVLPATTTVGAVSATELSYLDGTTSALQSQITLKAPIDSPHFTGLAIFDNEVTALGFNASGTGDHYAHLGNAGDITVPDTDKAGIIWFNEALGKWRVTTDNAGTVDNLAMEP